MTHFISFGGPHPSYYKALNRLLHEALDLNIFTSIKGFTDKDLKEDTTFWKQHGKFLENNKRGYGFWLWKPYIVMKTLETMKENEVLFYADAGCKFDKKHPIKILQDKVDLVRRTKKIVGGFTCPELYWTKMDLIKYLKMENHPKLRGCQYIGGAFMLIKTPQIVDFIKEWWRIATIDNYHFIDNSPSKVKNHRGFKEHRHDQSIFSLLVKKHDLFNTVSIRGRGGIFDTTRFRNGPNIGGSPNFSKKLIPYLVGNKLEINCRYNELFADVAVREKKKLTIIYKDTQDKTTTKEFPENTKILLSNVKQLINVKYEPLHSNGPNTLKCLINI